MEFKKILITTDFSDYSFYAIPYAVELAEKFKARLTLMHVIEPIITPADFAWGGYNVTELENKTREYAEENLQKALRDRIPEGMKAEVSLAFGNPFKEVVQFAKDENFDLIVISTHGLTGLSHIIFGSTTEKIVRKSPVPVLTIRHPEHKFEMI